ncbi:DUF4229 domain-containing protein [Actinoplanes sp. NPDC051494]|uniref:DUF4229 domain-containing protein n=1 Tax=Actinoplanes sp. NPDC051494 TaxID=3363907 RepID=UPI003791EA03
MSPAVKYTLGRLGLFIVVFALLLPVPLNFLVKAMIALIASAGFSYFLLAKWRTEMAEQLDSVATRRSAEKERLRAALAGDEAAAAEGDRAAEPAKPEPAKPGSANAEPASTKPANAKPANVEPAAAEAEPAKAEPVVSAGPAVKADSAQAEVDSKN